MRISDWSSDVCSSDLQAGLEEVQPAERGKLVEHQEEPVTLGFCVIAAASVQPLCQAPPDLVQDQADQRLGAADVRGRYHQVQRDRVRGFDEVGDAPVRAGGYRSNRGSAVQLEEGQGSRELGRASCRERWC